MSKNKVVTFGEIMLRLAPEGYYRFIQADKFNAVYGGGEANVAVSLANFGLDVKYVTKLPGNDIGQAAVNSLRRFGIDTGSIARGGQRVGIYFLEKGASQRASKVIYDRAHSSIAMAAQGDFNWEEIFDGSEWFHFTGITPALGDNVSDICLNACRTAKKLGLTVSCDLNYRKNLWTREKAGQVMTKLMEYVDVCIANEEDAGDVFGIWADDSDITGGKLSQEGYKSVAGKLMDRFGFKNVAITLRTSISANDNHWGAMLYDGRDFYFSKSYPIHIVDRVGGGDSFGAGLIYSLITGKAPKEALEFAVAASCLKHTIEGDYNLVSVDEVNKLAGGDATGRVQR
jgi:2-dehydro-3-deoxygluconokinase